MDISNEDFIISAFKSCKPNAAPWVTGFDGDPYTVPPQFWGGKPILSGMPWIIRPNHNNYVCLSSFITSPDNSWSRRKRNYSAMHAVMVDDIGTKIDHDKIKLEPSVLNETSPGNYQAWYFLDPPESDPVRADNLIKGMIANGLTADSSDPGMRGVTRYGRLPVGVNAKKKYVELLGKPFVQRVHHWSLSTRYHLDEIANAYGVDLDRIIQKKYKLSKPLVTKHLQDVDHDLQLLCNAGLYIEPISSLLGAHTIICPWLYQHTDQEPSGTAYFEPSEENFWRGGFKCHHGHCVHRSMTDLRYFLNRLMQVQGDHL